MILDLVEAVIGRRRLWKLGRRMYLHARREGSQVIEENGELALQQAVVARARSAGRPLRVIDVGANHGQWSRSLLGEARKQGLKDVRLTQFEPVPDMRPSLDRLRDEFADTAEVTLIPCAASDEPGRLRMIMTGASAGTHHLAAEDYPYEGEEISVDVVTVDGALKDDSPESLDLVKIDAEGFDPKVLQGMQGLLAGGRVDVIQIEYSILFIRSRSYLYDVFKIAERHGYRVAVLSRKGFEIHAEWHPDLEHFYPAAIVLLHPRAESLMPSREVRYGDDFAHD